MRVHAGYPDVPCLVLPILFVKLMHRDLVGRDRGLLSRQSGDRVTTTPTSSLFPGTRKAYFREPDSCGCPFAEDFVGPPPRFCLQKRVATALCIASLDSDSDDGNSVDCLTSERSTALQVVRICTLKVFADRDFLLPNLNVSVRPTCLSPRYLASE